MTSLSRDAVPQLSLSSGASLEALTFLEERIEEKREDILNWFKAQWEETPPPMYGSVDLRNAGFKLAPIDMNLFPAGFNNLNPHFLGDATQAAKTTILAFVPQAKKLVLVPESHTRNLFYWENVKALVDLLEAAGFEVAVATLGDLFGPIKELELPSGKKLRLEQLERKGDKVFAGQLDPDLILLNNDLSSGIPPLLENLQQPLFPPAELGWHQRLKSEHFQFYSGLSAEFAALVGFDPWLITPLFRHCGAIDFLHREGMDCLMENARQLFSDIEKKYQEYQVPHKPFIIVKADAGTQGMAVMTVRNMDDLADLNRKQRTAMSTSKGGLPVTRVIVQEGVYTFETFGPEANVAEPVVYLWGQCVIGGFYRIHQGRGVDENLNAPGMHFKAFPFAWDCSSWSKSEEQHPYQKHLYTYGVIAQLSMLAAAKEMKDLATS